MTCAATDVVTSFQALIDQKEFDQAALLVTEDAEISTPFGKKTKEQFLKDLRGNGGPVWRESAPGDHAKQCITDGVRKIGFVKVNLKRVVEINGDDKICKITVSKK